MTDFSRIIQETDTEQVRVTVSEFKGTQYLQIRKYFQDFEGLWVPTPKGISMPLGISNTLGLFLAISELMSNAEIALIDESLQEVIYLYKKAVDEP